MKQYRKMLAMLLALCTLALLLAESWEISEDSTEYTWHLRQGVKFHNGQEMTAEDAAAGWPARATRRP